MHYVYHYQVSNLFRNADETLAALTKVVDATGLMEIDRHHVVYEIEDRKDIVGITAVAFLAESHVSITTYPEDNTAFIDIASCVEFEIEDLDCRLRERGFDVDSQV